MRHIRSYLTSRVAATGAAVVLLGGGAALATEAGDTMNTQETGGDTEEETTEEETTEEETTEEETTEEETTEEEAPEEEAPEEETTEEEAPEESDEAEEPEGSQDSPDPDAAPVDDTSTSGSTEDERSDTAKRVHEALSGDPDTRPGDEGFGASVSKNARAGGLGQEVSRAARGLDADEPEGAANGTAETEEEPVEAEEAGDANTHKPGPPAHSRGRG